MPEASGISAVIQGPSTIDTSAMQEFGAQLVAMRQRQQQTAMQDLQTATQIAQYDPVLAEEVGGKALKQVSKASGKTPSELYFQNIFKESQQEKQQKSDLSAANIENLRAGTAASQADTAYKQQETSLSQANAKHEQNIQDAETRLAAGKYDSKDAQAADLRIVQMGRHLTPEELDNLDPETRDKLKAFKDQQQKYTIDKFHMDLADLALNNSVEFKDPKTGKSEYRPMTAEEFQNFKDGKPVPGLTPGSAQSLKTQAVTNALNQFNSQTERMRADAEVSSSTTLETQRKAAAAKDEAAAIKDLMQAHAIQQKGGPLPQTIEDLLKSVEVVKEQKANGEPVNKKTLQAINDQLSAWYGIAPEDSKGWIDRAIDAVWGDSSKVSPASEEAAGKPAAKPSLPYRMGQATGELPAAVGAFSAGAQTAMGKGLTGTMTDIEDYIKGLADSQKKGPNE